MVDLDRLQGYSVYFYSHLRPIDCHHKRVNLDPPNLQQIHTLGTPGGLAWISWLKAIHGMMYSWYGTGLNG